MEDQQKKKSELSPRYNLEEGKEKYLLLKWFSSNTWKKKLKINTINFSTDASASEEGVCRIGPPSKEVLRPS